jgi:flagellin-like protein
MDLKKIFNDNKAVSPVIGVVLMVAITVILAAAIGSSVFGQGPSESAPQANINIVPVDENTIKLEHLGGDTIVFDDNATTKLMFSAGDTSFEINIAQFAPDTAFDVGDTKVIYLHDVNDASNTNQTQPSGQFATVKIVDVKTSQLIADKDLRF